jgi:hypothetical protein
MRASVFTTDEDCGCVRLRRTLIADSLKNSKQIAHRRLILHRHMQIPRRDTHVGVASRVANLGKRAAACQGMADECVAAVMNGERAETVGTENLAGRAEPLAERVAGKRDGFATWAMRIEKESAGLRAVLDPFDVPPPRNQPST